MDARARALERLYRERYLHFRNALATVTGSRETARDVVQEAFARALRERKALRDDEALEPWVWRIAFRLALGERAASLASLNGSLDPQLVEPAPSPELDDALRALPARQRLIVFLRYFGDLSYADIAALCEISEGTVGATLSHARAALADALERKELV